MRHNFQKLKVWEKSRHLVRDIYLYTKVFPPEEMYGLTSQMRRAAISIPSNIAEGCGRGTDKQLSHFLDVSIGSLCELETQTILAWDLGFFSEIEYEQIVQKIIEVRRMVMSFRQSLKRHT